MPKRKACDSCHVKKIHCDGRKPQCEWCKHRQLPCTYPGGQGRPKSAYPADCRGCCAELTTGRELCPKPTGLGHTDRHSEEHAHGRESFPLSDNIFYGGLHFAGLNLGDIGSQHGIPVFSESGRLWMQRRTGEENAFGGTYSMPSLPLASLTMPLELPQLKTVARYYTLFSSSPLRRVFPVLDPDAFPKTIELAYNSDVNAKACVFAFVAVFSVLEPEQTLGDPVDADLCAAAAEQSLLAALAHPTVDGLQAAVMLCVYRDFSGQLQSALMAHSLAYRCILLFRGHVQPGGHIRQLFWLCYFFDKHIALRMGQPPVIDDEQCDLALPEGYAGCDLDTQWPLYPSDLALTKIKSRVFTTLYSPKALQKSDAQLLRDIRELDDELETWRMSVPFGLRPLLSVVTSPDGLTHAMFVIFVHFEYFFLLASIHRASGRSQAWHGQYEPALSSSLSLSVQASRSILMLLKAASKDVHNESFWLITFYPIWATITVFCNLLYAPEAAEAESDMELLELLPSLIKAIRVRQLTAAETMHLSLLDTFFAEVVRLGNCAIRRDTDVEIADV